MNKGRIDWKPRLKLWRVIKYVGRKDVRIGDYREYKHAVAALQYEIRLKAQPPNVSLEALALSKDMTEYDAQHPMRNVGQQVMDSASGSVQS